MFPFDPAWLFPSPLNHPSSSAEHVFQVDLH